MPYRNANRRRHIRRLHIRARDYNLALLEAPYASRRKWILTLPYTPALDGLRAIAVIAVVFYHAWGRRVPGGWMGVDIFFVLSGYLITTIMIGEIRANKTVNLKSFYIRRWLRLTPAFSALLLALLLESLISHNVIKNLESIAISAAYLMNWNRAFEWLPERSLGHTWSLAMEEQFYLIWPLFLLHIFKLRNAEKLLIFAIIVVVGWRIALVCDGAKRKEHTMDLTPTRTVCLSDAYWLS